MAKKKECEKIYKELKGDILDLKYSSDGVEDKILKVLKKRSNDRWKIFGGILGVLIAGGSIITGLVRGILYEEFIAGILLIVAGVCIIVLLCILEEYGAFGFCDEDDEDEYDE